MCEPRADTAKMTALLQVLVDEVRGLRADLLDRRPSALPLAVWACAALESYPRCIWWGD